MAKMRRTTGAVFGSGSSLCRRRPSAALPGWVRSGVGKTVSVGRASAEEPAFDFRLGGYRGADSDLHAGPFALGHAAEHARDQFVGFGFGVDRAADLGYPESDAVVGEDGHGQAVLVAVEGALGFADHDRVEATVRVGEGVVEARRRPQRGTGRGWAGRR